MGVRLDREAPGECLGHGQVCTGQASNVLVVMSDERQQIAVIGLCAWCAANEGPYLMPVLVEQGWNESIGLVPLTNDVLVRKVEDTLNDLVADGLVVLGEMPSAS